MYRPLLEQRCGKPAARNSARTKAGARVSRHPLTSCYADEGRSCGCGQRGGWISRFVPETSTVQRPLVCFSSQRRSGRAVKTVGSESRGRGFESWFSFEGNDSLCPFLRSRWRRLGVQWTVDPLHSLHRKVPEVMLEVFSVQRRCLLFPVAIVSTVCPCSLLRCQQPALVLRYIVNSLPLFLVTLSTVCPCSSLHCQQFGLVLRYSGQKRSPYRGYGLKFVWCQKGLMCM